MRIHIDALIDAMLEKTAHFNNMRNSAVTPAMRKHYEELTILFGAMAHEFAKDKNYMTVSNMIDNYMADIRQG